MSSAARNGLPWSPREVRRLRDLTAAGKTLPEIAEILDRTRIGVKSKAASLDIVFRSTRGSGSLPAKHGNSTPEERQTGRIR
jgi:hypothetical protein